MKRVVDEDMVAFELDVEGPLGPSQASWTHKLSTSEFEGISVHRAHDAIALEPALRQARAGVVAGILNRENAPVDPCNQHVEGRVRNSDEAFFADLREPHPTYFPSRISETHGQLRTAPFVSPTMALCCTAN